ncbi:hypothetical protein J699_00759 [Acinetobacter sp. 1000160]|nr:hypothetical protein J522_3945 [Acinetobacter baumannii 146457]EYT22431.1 hypothetical protein J699_00759 [Acinetobacter sp. 1000160]
MSPMLYIIIAIHVRHTIAPVLALPLPSKKTRGNGGFL